MKNLPDRILDLLNRSESDSLFAEFQAELDLRNSAIIRHQEGNGRLVWYAFKHLGVSIYSVDERFFSTVFHIAPLVLKDGKATLSYVHPLPFGLPPDSCRADVRSILGQPYQVNNPCGSAKCEYKSESYVIEPWHVVFWYSLPGETLDEVRVLFHPRASDSEA